MSTRYALRGPRINSETCGNAAPNVALLSRANYAPPVEKKIASCLTGPVNHGVLFKVNCFAQNPSAAMRGGFLHRTCRISQPAYLLAITKIRISPFDAVTIAC
jgi:hypothetical protein